MLLQMQPMLWSRCACFGKVAASEQQAPPSDHPTQPTHALKTSCTMPPAPTADHRAQHHRVGGLLDRQECRQRNQGIGGGLLGTLSSSLGQWEGFVVTALLQLHRWRPPRLHHVPCQHALQAGVCAWEGGRRALHSVQQVHCAGGASPKPRTKMALSADAPMAPTLAHHCRRSCPLLTRWPSAMASGRT